MNNSLKTIKSGYRNYNAFSAGTILSLGGGAIGGLVGVGLPLYLGWEIGDYVKETFEMGTFIGTTTKVIGAVGLTSVVGSFTFPLCMIGGAGAGAIIGGITGKMKTSLEDFFCKKD
jgi:hypothetical protein